MNYLSDTTHTVTISGWRTSARRTLYGAKCSCGWTSEIVRDRQSADEQRDLHVAGAIGDPAAEPGGVR